MQFAIRAPVWLRPESVADVMKLSVPIALSRMTMPIMSLTDAVVLGRMAQFELPYITNGYVLITIGLALGMGILNGVQVLTAELSGVGKQKETGRVFRRGLWVGLVIGLAATLISVVFAQPFYAALGFDEEHLVDGAASAAKILAIGLTFHMAAIAAALYLEALRKPNIVVAVMYVSVGLNLVFDLAFVAGWWGFPQMGADGVAWASTGCRIFQMVVLLALVAIFTPGFKRSVIAPAGEFIRQNTVGAGGAIANMAEFTAFNSTFVIATLVSTVAGTIYSLAVQPIFLAFMLFVGIGTATSVRVAEAFGRKEFAGVRDASRLGIFCFTLAGVVVAIALFLGRDLFAAAMVTAEGDINLQPLLSPVLAIAALALFFDGLQAVASMALRAQEIVWGSAIIHIGSYFILMAPAAYVLAIRLGGGAEGVMWGVVIGSAAAGLGQWLFLEYKTARRFTSNAPSAG